MSQDEDPPQLVPIQEPQVPSDLQPQAKPVDSQSHKTLSSTHGWLGHLKFKVNNTVVLLQPKRPKDVRVPTLQLDLRSGSVTVSQKAERLPDDTPCVLGIIGLLKLESGSVLAVITKAKRVSAVADAVFHVEETQLITHESVKSSMKDVRLAGLLQEALDVKNYGAHMYFSHKEDITNTAQRKAAAAAASTSSRGRGGGDSGSSSKSLCKRADMRFVWNRTLMQPLIDAGCDAWATPLMVGYVGQLQGARALRPEAAAAAAAAAAAGNSAGAAEAAEATEPEAVDLGPGDAESTDRDEVKPAEAAGSPGAGSGAVAASGLSGAAAATAADSARGVVDVKVTLWGRMAAARAGTLPWRSGLDAQGHAAHFVETEQVVELVEEGSRRAVHSFVQVQGSPPLVWTRPPNLLPPPLAATRLARVEHQQGPVEKHLKQLREAYQGLAIVHLTAGGARDEQMMTLLLRNQVERQAAAQRCQLPLQVLPAAGCSGKALERHVAADLEPLCAQHRCFEMAGDRVTSRQAGVIRTGCSTGCDAANAVQHACAMQQLGAFFASQGLLAEGQPLDVAHAEIVNAVSTMWANHGTIVSDQISGTGCTSSHRSKGWDNGLVDGVMAAWIGVHRYAHANFADARKQDAIDLLTGAYLVQKTDPALGRRDNNYSTLQLGALCLGWALVQLLVTLLFTSWAGIDWGSLSYRAGVPLLPGCAMLGFVLHQGTRYLERPQLNEAAWQLPDQ